MSTVSQGQRSKVGLIWSSSFSSSLIKLMVMVMIIVWQPDVKCIMMDWVFIGLTNVTSLGNSGLCWTVFARNRDTAVPAEGNGDLQTLICLLVARPRRCLTLLNPAPWQNWMAAYLGYTLRMRMLFCGWPIMVNDTHTRRRPTYLW